jgi:hypothetical protein
MESMIEHSLDIAIIITVISFIGALTYVSVFLKKSKPEIVESSDIPTYQKENYRYLSSWTTDNIPITDLALRRFCRRLDSMVGQSRQHDIAKAANKLQSK